MVPVFSSTKLAYLCGAKFPKPNIKGYGGNVRTCTYFYIYQISENIGPETVQLISML